jgi:hypothetical protein
VASPPIGYCGDVATMSITNIQTFPDVLAFLAVYAAWLIGLYVVVHAGWL